MARTTKSKAVKDVAPIETVDEAIEEKGANAEVVPDDDAKMPKEKGMNVCEAMGALCNGKAVRRKSWTTDVCVHVRRGETIPMLYQSGHYFAPYQPSISDVTNDDWEIVTDFKE